MNTSSYLLQQQVSLGATQEMSQLDVEKQRTEKEAEQDSANEGSSSLPTAEEPQAPPSAVSAVSGLMGVISRIATRSTITTPGPPPDGGSRAWLCGT